MGLSKLSDGEIQESQLAEFLVKEQKFVTYIATSKSKTTLDLCPL